jgi:hypothetical protein
VQERALDSTILVLLKYRRRTIPAALPLADALTAELENVRAEIKLTTGHDTYGAGANWRERDDDLVLAVALAAWIGEDDAAQQAVASAWGERWALPEIEL